jgi:hypothetical protein
VQYLKEEGMDDFVSEREALTLNGVAGVEDRLRRAKVID